MKPFLKCTKQGRSFDKYDTHKALRSVLDGKKVSITADETTDGWDRIIFNILMSTQGQVYLVHVATLDTCKL